MMCEDQCKSTDCKEYIKCKFLRSIGKEHYREANECKSKIICLMLGVFTIHQVIIETREQDSGNESELEIHKSFSDNKYK